MSALIYFKEKEQYTAQALWFMHTGVAAATFLAYYGQWGHAHVQKSRILFDLALHQTAAFELGIFSMYVKVQHNTG